MKKKPKLHDHHQSPIKKLAKKTLDKLENLRLERGVLKKKTKPPAAVGFEPASIGLLFQCSTSKLAGSAEN